jgi:LacI family transcriptional regulator
VATTSIREVARHAGVSLGTVSNVLNRPDSVGAETRRRVEVSIRELGFVRNESARALRTGSSRTVGLVVLDVANPFFTDVARGAEDVAEENGMVVTLCNSSENAERETRHLDHLEEQRVQGVLITPVEGATPRLERLVERGIPVVLVDRGSGARNRCSVAVDDVMGGQMAVGHLLEGGHRRIAFVGGPMRIQQVQDRYAGAQAAVTSHGDDEGSVVSTLEVVETPSLTLRAGTRAGASIASMPPSRRPTAVFCANDLLALGLLQEVVSRGLDVPGDLAIVGYDDIDFAAAAVVPLSSVRQPRDQLGRAATELLFDEISAGASHRHRQILFEPELVVRRSAPGLSTSTPAPSWERCPSSLAATQRPVDTPDPSSGLAVLGSVRGQPDLVRCALCRTESRPMVRWMVDGHQPQDAHELSADALACRLPTR